MLIVIFTWSNNLYTDCFHFQLDPQNLQNKDWQRTVIAMNGVSKTRLSVAVKVAKKNSRNNTTAYSCNMNIALLRQMFYFYDRRATWKFLSWHKNFFGECNRLSSSFSTLLFQVEVKLSMRFTSREFSLKRMPSRKQSGVFGVKIHVVTKWVDHMPHHSVQKNE